MPESTRTNAPRGQGSAYRVGTGWRGSIYVTDEDGKRVRRFVSADTSDGVVAKLLERFGHPRPSISVYAAPAASSERAAWTRRVSSSEQAKAIMKPSACSSAHTSRDWTLPPD